MQHSLRFSYTTVLLVLAVFLFLFPRIGLAAQINVTISDNSYTPKNITINPGDTVRWINSGSSSHTVTADDGSFDSVTIASGQSFAAMFNVAGNYAYHCKIHGGAGGVGQSGVVTVVAPQTNTSSTITQLQAQVQALLAQLNTLKTQGTTAVPAVSNSGSGIVLDSSSCPLVGRGLRRGSMGEDVTRLQQFLARDGSVYPEAIVSGYYGALTEKAVQRWQIKYNIVSSGTPNTTGFGVVGPRTASAIAILCTTGSYGGVAGPGAPMATVGALIAVSPISGNAPLEVKISATINTAQSCQAATYLLDFGDGSAPLQIPLGAGACQPSNQTYSHIYKYGGTYTVKLSAEGHETAASVAVAGPPPPVITPGLPQETFRVSPSSGAAPLTVTFSGVVNSNDAGFCTDGCASVLDFGDGSQATVNLPGSVGGWINYSLTHTYTQSGGFRATLYQGGAGAAQPTVGSATIVVGPAAPATTTPNNPVSAYSYFAPVVTSSGSDPFQFTISFDLPSSCTGFSLVWGDGLFGDLTQSDGGSSCPQTPVQKSYVHTYAGAGTYNIILKRGPTLSNTDQSTLTIVN